MRYLLDNILLTHETLDWAKHSKQPLLFLKLDFCKAYDMVDRSFLSKTMAAFGFPKQFIAMMMLLFQDAQATIKVNGSQSLPFPIQRGVRQGCPLAPYLFILITEVLNLMVKTEVVGEVIKGIKLPVEDKQQVMAQYANDTSMTLLDEEGSVKAMISTIDRFCTGSGLLFNWDKSLGYWHSEDPQGQPQWTNQLRISWAAEGNMGKLLGLIFGLSLT